MKGPEVGHVGFLWAQRLALDDVSFRVEPGRFFHCSYPAERF